MKPGVRVLISAIPTSPSHYFLVCECPRAIDLVRCAGTLKVGMSNQLVCARVSGHLTMVKSINEGSVGVAGDGLSLGTTYKCCGSCRRLPVIYGLSGLGQYDLSTLSALRRLFFASDNLKSDIHVELNRYDYILLILRTRLMSEKCNAPCSIFPGKLLSDV